MRRNDILKFLRKHNGWVLQFCRGCTLGSEWWWLRKGTKGTNTIIVNGNSAKSATRSMRFIECLSDDTTTTYQLRD